MSSITVRIPTPLRPFVEDAPVVNADAETVGAALAQIGARCARMLMFSSGPRT